MQGLYAIADVDTLQRRGFDPVDFARAVLTARPAAVQLRAKSSPPREVLGLLRALAPLCRRACVPLVANDRADLAVLAGCDMVHVGQGDLPVKLARRIAPTLGIGVSTHNLEQLAKALEERPTYVAFGPVFSTRSKTAPDPIVGIELLAEAHAMAKAARIPLVAIGGIDVDNGALISTRCESAAVIAALLPPVSADPMTKEGFVEAVRARAFLLHAMFGGSRAAVPAAGEPLTGVASPRTIPAS